jgi:hypothetical protein
LLIELKLNTLLLSNGVDVEMKRRMTLQKKRQLKSTVE